MVSSQLAQRIPEFDELIAAFDPDFITSGKSEINRF